MIFVWEWNVPTHSYAFVTWTLCLGTSSISANVTLCKSPVSRVTAELVPVLWSSLLAKILQLDGFKQNSVMKRSTRKRICGHMLLLGKLPAPVGHWPAHGDTEVAMEGPWKGLWSQEFSADRFLTSPAEWLITLLSAELIWKVLVLILLPSSGLRIKWHKISSLSLLLLAGAQLGGAAFGAQQWWHTCLDSFLSVLLATSAFILLHRHLFFIFFYNDLEFSWQQLWKPMALIQVKLQATLCRIHSNLF